MEKEKQQTLFKGELMEELLRNYFINLGYYVARGVKYRYENNDVTDVDLYLYGRASSLTRERINVDIKNKKSPQAFERILWANGLMKLLNLNRCIVATTDIKPSVHSFGKLHDTTILDGTFLAKIRSTPIIDRLSEDELLTDLSRFKSHKIYPNKDWRYVYEGSKSRLLSELDFSGFNSTVGDITYAIDKILTDKQKKHTAARLLYVLLSHMLIIIDYLLKDIAFLEQSEREKKLSSGFKFGNLGKEGIDKIIAMAVSISGNKSAGSIMKSLDAIPTDILKDFFSKSETTKNIFQWAKEFEQAAFNKVLPVPDSLPSHLKGMISVILDFHNVDRRNFFDSFPKERVLPNVGMRARFMTSLGKENAAVLNKFHNEIIDEAIESILAGTSTIDGKAPQTTDEEFYLIASHFIAANANLEAVVKGILQSDEGIETVTVNYRGEPFVFKSKELPGKIKAMSE